MNTVQYPLVENFQYAAGGDMTEAQFIELSPPTPRLLSNLAPVKSEVMKAIVWSQNQDDVDDTEGEDSKGEEASISPKAMMTTLELAPGVDVAKVLLNINAMLVGKDGLAKIEGEHRYTVPISENDISIVDTYGLAGTFLVNFILPSL